MSERLAALDLVPEAVVVLDYDGSIRHVNARARALLGLTVADVGARLGERLAFRDDAGNPCGIDLDEETPRGRRVAERLPERVLWLRDGPRRRPVSVAGRYGDGEVVLTFRSAGRRERVDAARSDLVATVSHEIRSPLTSVKGFTRTMLTRWDRFSDEQKRTMLETINQDADRVTRLLAELLAVSRIDAGRVQVHLQPVSLRGVVESVTSKLAHRPEGRDRDVSVTIAEGLPLVTADPDKLEQIVTNLVENALKYAPESEVRVHAEPARDGRVRLTVEDDGPGIPRDQSKAIFQKFGRGRGTRRSGTGLGLFITRGLARAMGGDAWCESAEGHGAAFHVDLGAAGAPQRSG